MSAVPLYDSHAHLADERILQRAEQELAAFRTVGGHSVLVAAARRSEWARVISLTRSASVLGALGIHPFFVEDWVPGRTSQELASYLASSNRLIAVGEIGLDFQNGRDDASLQIRILEEQLQIAQDCGLPVVLHNRKSWHEFFGILDSFGQRIQGVCHNFTGSPELAREVVKRGLYVSFAGPLTYPNARRAHASARWVPTDRVLVETDAPDLPPWACDGKESSPADVRHVLRQLAELRGQSLETMAEQVAANFGRLFRPSPRHSRA